MSGLNYDTKLSLIQRMVDKGDAYRTFVEFEIPANGSRYFSISVGDKAVGFFSRLIVPDQPNIRYEVRTNATIDSYVGSPIPIRNLNGKSENSSACIFRECTQTSLGELVDIDKLPGQAASGSNASGQVYRDPDDLKINPDNKEYLLVLSNPNNVIADTLLYLKWFETPPNIWS